MYKHAPLSFRGSVLPGGSMLPGGYVLPVIFMVLTSCLQEVQSVTTADFFDYSTATPLRESYMHIDLGTAYPHWADPTNKQIDVVNSGIIRFSGLDGLNTLDLLVLSNSLPLATQGNTDNIFYQEIVPKNTDKEKFKTHLKDASISDWRNFDPKSMLICTWIDVPFYSNGASSTFQIVLGSNGNRTIAIIQVVKMNVPNVLTFYPEMDLRFAYEGGTKFIRTGYLKQHGGITATKGTNVAAVANTNSNLPGRWILDLNAVNVTEEKEPAPTAPPSIPVEEFQNSTEIGLSGQFVFNELLLDNNVLTSEGNNDEISVILSKKEADTRYNKLNTNIKDWVKDVYKKAANASGTTVNIIGYKAGSLVVEYSVQLPNVKEVCADASKADCLNKVSTDVKKVSANQPVQTADMSGKIDDTRTIVTDFNECAATNVEYCDRNAYCINFPNELSYGCKCKDGFQGNGFPGNCKKPKEDFLDKNLAIIAGVAAAGGLVIFLIIGIICYVKQKEKTNWAFKRLAMQRTLPKEYLPPDAMDVKKGRSTRKVLIPAAYSGRDFDIYHRTSNHS